MTTFALQKNNFMNLQHIPQIKHTDSGNFFLLAGPCAIEGEEMALRIAEKLVGITDKLQIPYVFKGSFKKANRSRIDSFSGIGDEKALKIPLLEDAAYIGLLKKTPSIPFDKKEVVKEVLEVPKNEISTPKSLK